MIKQFKIEFKNLFATYPDLQKLMYHLNHYIQKMNDAKTGVFYCHNLELLLFNISAFKNLVKHSSKKAENVLYYPFTGKMALNNLNVKLEFQDYKNNQTIKQIIEEKNIENLFTLINKNIEKLNNQKQNKENLLICFENIEKYLWIMYTVYKLYIDEYEKKFK